MFLIHYTTLVCVDYSIHMCTFRGRCVLTYFIFRQDETVFYSFVNSFIVRTLRKKIEIEETSST